MLDKILNLNNRSFWKLVGRLILGGIVILLVNIALLLIFEEIRKNYAKKKSPENTNNLQNELTIIPEVPTISKLIVGSWSMGIGNNNIVNQGIITFEEDSSFYNSQKQSGRYKFKQADNNAQKYNLFLYYDDGSSEIKEFTYISEDLMQGEVYKLIKRPQKEVKWQVSQPKLKINKKPVRINKNPFDKDKIKKKNPLDDDE